MSLNVPSMHCYLGAIREVMISFKVTLGFLFGLLITAVLFLGVLCYKKNADALRSSAWVRHTHAVIHTADEISIAYNHIYTYTLAFLFRSDSASRSEYAASRQILTARLTEMKYLVQDNPKQQQRIDSLGQFIQQLTLVTDSLVLAPISSAAVHKAKGLVRYTVLANVIMPRIEQIKQTEQQLLALREAEHRESTERFKNIFSLLLLGIVILLAAAFLSTRYNFNKRMHVQDQLERTNVLFEKVFYDSPIAIVISEYNSGKILNCNKVFASMVNYNVNEVIGKTAAELRIFENSEQRKQIVEGAVKNGMARRNEVYIKPRDKEPIYISIHAHEVPLYDRKCLLSAIIDLSTHKQAEDDIKRALEKEIELNKLKSGFVTLASHEFRTPLTTILSSAFLLENYSFGENQEKSVKHLHKIKSAVGSLTAILDDFLSVTKIEEGQVRAHHQAINIKKYLEDLCNNLQALTKQGQTIYYTHSGDTVVITDPTLLGNIVNNLVTNSIKYSPENSPIYVSSDVNSKIHLSVQDKGIGIPEADQKHLFDRFYRASNAGTAQGTGLGLHIMKHYVEMLNGSIILQSKPGQGTHVQIALTRMD
jgi:PAS domain S-box-containing protein